MRLLAPLLLLCLASCSFHKLSVQTQYLSNQYFASYHVGTPDPERDDSLLGQRLFIEWCLPKKMTQGKELYLHLNIRFKNRKEDRTIIPICKRKGYTLYNVINKEFEETGGIRTYLIEITDGTDVLASWKHPLWVELITIKNEQIGEKVRVHEEINFVPVCVPVCVPG